MVSYMYGVPFYLYDGNYEIYLDTPIGDKGITFNPDAGTYLNQHGALYAKVCPRGSLVSSGFGLIQDS